MFQNKNRSFFMLKKKDEINKNQIIKIIIIRMNLIFHKNKIIFMMLMRIAVNNINKNICHTVLDIDLDKKQKLTVSHHVRKL